MSRHRIWQLVALAAVVLASLQAAPALGDDPFTVSEHYFPSSDGTMLHANVLLPTGAAPDTRFPVILEASPYHSSGGWPSGVGQPYTAPRPHSAFTRGNGIARGYGFVQVEMPGTGASAGCAGGGGARDQAAARSAVAWIIEQPWSDGHVGMISSSFPGWTQYQAAAGNPEGLDVVIPTSAPSGTDGFFFHDRVPMFGMTWIVPTQWHALFDVNPPGVLAPTEQWQAFATTRDPQCIAETSGYHEARGQRDHPFWDERHLDLGDSHVPALVFHGYNDDDVPVNSTMEGYSTLGGDKGLLLGQTAHIPQYTPWVLDLMFAWYDHYMRGRPAARELQVAYTQDREGQWRVESTYPPSDAVDRHVFDLNGGAYLDAWGNSAEPNPPNEPAYYPNGQGIWTISEPVTQEFRWTGSPLVTVEVTATTGSGGQPKVVALVYDIPPDGTTADIVSRGAALIEGDGPVTVRGFWNDDIVRVGHRIGVLITGADDYRFDSFWASGRLIDVSGGSLTLPTLECARTQFMTEEIGIVASTPRAGVSLTAEQIAAATVPTDQAEPARTTGHCVHITPEV